MSLFSKLIRIGQEDLSTEVLVHLLSREYSKRNPQFRIRMISEIQGIKQNDDVEFLSQLRFGTNGIPDIIGVGADSLIVIENKLKCLLSGEDQLVKYLNVFDSELEPYFPSYRKSSIEKMTLVVIAPECLMPEIKKMSDKAIPDKFSSFEAMCKEQHIQLVWLCWERILEHLNEDHEIEIELKNFVGEFILSVLSQNDIDEIRKNGIGENQQLKDRMSNFLRNFFRENNSEFGIEEIKIHSRAEDVYLAFDKVNNLYFGYFERAHKKWEESIFFLEIKKNGISCSGLPKNLLSIGMKCHEYSSDAIFISFDDNNMENWTEQLIKISNAVKS